MGPLLEIGYVKEDGDLVTCWISPCAASIARRQGWMVFADFERWAVFNGPRLVTDDEGDL